MGGGGASWEGGGVGRVTKMGQRVRELRKKGMDCPSAWDRWRDQFVQAHAHPYQWDEDVGGLPDTTVVSLFCHCKGGKDSGAGGGKEEGLA